jgi:hypothetical protein
MTGGIELETEPMETPPTGASSNDLLRRSAKIQRRLAALPRKRLNFDLAALVDASPETRWTTTDLRQPLSSEPPDAPVCQG